MSEIFRLRNEIVECQQIARMIEQHGERFLYSIYRPEELALCQNRSKTTETYAGLWAGKRAIAKALGWSNRRDVDWTEIEFRRSSEGEWVAKLHGSSRDRAEKLQVQRWEISLSFTRLFALATVLAIRGSV